MHNFPRVRARVDGVAFVAISLLGACGDQTGPAQQPVLVRATAIGAPLPGAAPVIRYRVENVSTRSVFILACGEQLVADLELRSASLPRWVSADAALRCPANLPYLLVEVRARSTGDGSITVPAAGTYRLRVQYRVDHPAGRLENAVSDPIEVSQPRTRCGT
jgi:hypothetical protein